VTLGPGAALGPYTIVAPLGAGGMGEVFRALDSRLGREVAVKVLPRAFAGDAERMRRFLREAQSASALNHPNILIVHEIGEDGGYHYLATELVLGATLRAIVLRGALPLAGAVEVAAQIAAALSAAHDAGVVHRDIKPENVMIRGDGLVKVLDFGLAKRDDVGPLDLQGETLDPGQTGPGVVLGTVAYMSPEQSRGGSVDARTDLWSLGVVLYEMLAGRQPFEGDSSVDVLANILHREPPPLALARDDLPAEIAAIVGRALAKRPERRYRSARELRDDLLEVAARLDAASDLGRLAAPDGAAPAPVARRSSTPVASAARHSIAVLAFRNLSSDPGNDYFCDGLAEELLNALSKIEGLKVAARTSAFAFKGGKESISEIGRALGVATVLEGSVRSSGSRMRIAVQLSNAADGFQVWSERYDRQTADIFDVQDEITLAVVDALRLRLFGEARAATLKRGTEDPEAHDHYLRGRYCWNQRTPESVRQAVEHYQRAIAADPGYAQAYAGLAGAWALFGWLSVASPRESMPRARAAALRALELDETVADAHAALGVYLSFYAWDQPAAERALRRAVDLNPGSATAHHWLGNIALLAMGRFDESLAEVRRAEELDPLSPVIASDTGVTLLYARRFGEAIAQFERTLAAAPEFYVARYHLGQALHSSGRLDAAIGEYERCLAATDDPWVTALLARSLARAGRRAEALRHRDDLLAEAERRYVPNVAFAVVHAALDEPDEALRRLERDLAERSLYPPFYAHDPVFDELRPDPRFAALVDRVRSSKLEESGTGAGAG